MEKYTSNCRLAIIVSHPIQYYSPLFKELAKEINLKVFYGFNPTSEQQGADGFGISFKWDIDLFDGYQYEFLENISKRPSSSYRGGCDTPDVDETLQRYDPTHVVTFGWHLKTYQQVLSYCKKKSISIAVRGDSKIDRNESIFKKIVKFIYYPFFLNKYNAFLSVGEENRKYLMKYKVSEDKIIFSPHAVDQDFWKGERTNHDKYTFIWVAKFIPLKRPFDVIDAFLKLYSKNTNIELKMVGSGPLLEASVIRASGNKDIKFLGFRNQLELREEYLNSDALILSSDSETWGLVVNEALSCGLKVIVSSEIGCASDLIARGVGVVYKVGSVLQLIELMENYYQDRDFQKYAEELKGINIIYSFERNLKSFKEFILLN